MRAWQEEGESNDSSDDQQQQQGTVPSIWDEHDDDDMDVSCRARPTGLCQVCGDKAGGRYFNAVVCIPCKAFYLRMALDVSGQMEACEQNGTCEITPTSRSCRFCRYQRCLTVGMCRRERPVPVISDDGRRACLVCGDIANGLHFGAQTCEGCKKFFRRAVREGESYACKINGSCDINMRTRNACRFCRYHKCLDIGMSLKAVHIGRPTRAMTAPYKHSYTRQPCQIFSRRNLPKFRSPVTSDSRSSASATRVGHNSPASIAQEHDLDPAASSTAQFDRQSSSVSNGHPLMASDFSITGLPPFIPSPEPLQISPNIVNEIQSRVRWPLQTTTLNISSSSSLDKLTSPLLATHSPAVAHHQNVTCDATQDYAKHLDSRLQQQVVQPRQQSPQQNNPCLVSTSTSRSREANSSSSFSNSYSTSSVIDPFNSSGLESFNITQLTMKRQHSNSTPVFRTREERGSSEGAEIDDDRRDALSASTSTTLAAERSDVSKEMTSSSWHLWENGSNPDQVLNLIRQISADYEKYRLHVEKINHDAKEKINQLCAKFGEKVRHQVNTETGNIIRRYVKAGCKYISTLPGYCSLQQADQLTLLKHGGALAIIILSSTQWYESDTRTFHTDFYSNIPPPDRPDYKPYLKWLDFASKLRELNLDVNEASLYSAIVILASNVPGLNDVARVESTRKPLLSALNAYIIGKRGADSRLQQALFDLVAELHAVASETLRQLHHFTSNSFGTEDDETEDNEL